MTEKRRSGRKGPNAFGVDVIFRNISCTRVIVICFRNTSCEVLVMIGNIVRKLR